MNKQTIITDWLLTDISQWSSREASLEFAELINKGQDSSINVLFFAELDDNKTWSENVGEIVMVRYKDGEVYVKILFYLDRVDIYGIDIEQIKKLEVIPFPINVASYCLNPIDNTF